jgi:hypothetical protein
MTKSSTTPPALPGREAGSRDGLPGLVRLLARQAAREAMARTLEKQEGHPDDEAGAQAD